MLVKKLKKEIVSDINSINRENIFEVEAKITNLIEMMKKSFGIEIKEEYQSNIVDLSSYANLNKFEDKDFLDRFGLTKEESIEKAKDNILIFTKRRTGGIVHDFSNGKNYYMPEKEVRKNKIRDNSLIKIISIDTKKSALEKNIPIKEYKIIELKNGKKNKTLNDEYFVILESDAKGVYYNRNIFKEKVKLPDGLEKYYFGKSQCEKWNLRAGDILDVSWYDCRDTTVLLSWRYFRDKLFTLEDIMIDSIYSEEALEKLLDFVSTNNIQNELDFNDYFYGKEVEKESRFNIRKNTVKEVLPQTLKGKNIFLTSQADNAKELANAFRGRGAEVFLVGKEYNDKKYSVQLKSADLVVCYTNRLGHMQYYNVKDIAKSNGIDFIHTTSTNISIVLSQIYILYGINSSI